MSKFRVQKYSEAFLHPQTTPPTSYFHPMFSMQKCLRILLHSKSRHILIVNERIQLHFICLYQDLTLHLGVNNSVHVKMPFWPTACAVMTFFSSYSLFVRASMLSGSAVCLVQARHQLGSGDAGSGILRNGPAGNVPEVPYTNFGNVPELTLPLLQFPNL
jgi:hypothetical protein